MKSWDLQISYWTLGGGANETCPLRVLRAAKEAGYDGAELVFDAEGVLRPETPESQIRSWRDAAGEMDMAVRTLCTGFYWKASFGDPDPEVRARAVAFSQSYLQAAAWMGAETVLIVPGVVAVPWNVPLKAVARYDEVWDRATRAVWQLLPLAERLGVCIGLENVWSWFLQDPAAMRAFVDQFASPWVGVYFDAGNCLINGYAEHWVAMLGHRVRAMHVKAFTRHDAAGGLSGFGRDIAKGDSDWPALTASLREIGYGGPITAELFPEGQGDDPVALGMPLARDTAAKLRGFGFGRAR